MVFVMSIDHDKISWDNLNFLANYQSGTLLSRDGRVYAEKQLGEIDKEAVHLLNESIKQISMDLEKVRGGKVLSDFVTGASAQMVQNAIKNYCLLGFDKIIPLDPQLIKKKSIFELDLVKLALSKANDESLDPSTRAKFLPQATGVRTENGTYYLFNDRMERAFIAKPALQEAGCPNNPQGNDQTRDGIAGGEGVIRERLVYFGQEVLKINFGIPDTYIMEEKNSVLSSEADFSKIKGSFETIKKVNPKMKMVQFIELMKQGKTPQEIADLIEKETSSLDDFGNVIQILIQKLREEKKDVNLNALRKELLKKGYSISDIQSHFPEIKKAIERENAVAELKGAVEMVWDQLLLPSSEKSLMSVQEYVPYCRSLSSLTMEEQEGLPIKEVHKLVIDLIFFNTDRHLSNVLVTPDKSLVLIDHGACLPRSEEDCIGLKQARYEFLEFPQCDVPLDAYYADAIISLDVDQFISSLKEDQMIQEESFGVLCHISEDCYNLIRFNLHLLQSGIQLGSTLKEMGSIHQITSNTEKGGEVVPLFSQLIKGNEKVDWKAVKASIRLLLE